MVLAFDFVVLSVKSAVSPPPKSERTGAVCFCSTAIFLLCAPHGMGSMITQPPPLPPHPPHPPPNAFEKKPLSPSISSRVCRGGRFKASRNAWARSRARDEGQSTTGQAATVLAVAVGTRTHTHRHNHTQGVAAAAAGVDAGHTTPSSSPVGPFRKTPSSPTSSTRGRGHPVTARRAQQQQKKTFASRDNAPP